MSKYRFDETEFVSFKLPFDKNTYISWLLSVAILTILVLMLYLFRLEPPKPIELQTNATTIELLNIGLGDGTGRSSGNYQEEGDAHKGKEATNELEDAQIASASNRQTKSNIAPEETSNLVTTSNPSTNDVSDSREVSNSKKNVGTAEGDPFGRGMGDEGFGSGAGHGYGDIDWGGGGNRIVVYKKIPQYPEGVNASGTIRLQFTVLQDGTIDKIFPIEKADPRLEKAAIEALRQWKFNSISENKVQVGIITLKFRLR